MKIPARGFTHAGKFHADDVFATALLQILRPDIQVTRGFVVPDNFDGIVYDIGDGMFDHHREPRQTRPNGVPYAAFGLLWRVLGPGLVGERQARLVDENFIQPLDLNDNTGEQNSLCDAIGFFNPTWDSPDSADDRFFEAVAVAKQILTRQIEAWLGTLPERERRLFIRRYWYGDALGELAAQEGARPAQLSQLMLRLRRSLRKHLEAEGAAI